jgi:disulfide bond formation protein DsbB
VIRASIEATPYARRWALAALILSLAGTAGSLYLSLGLGLKACPLCFYQRAFMMSVLAVLIVGWFADRTQMATFCLVSLPLAVAGAGVAAFHEYLVVTNVLECPMGLFDLGTAPAQSLAVFAVLTLSVAAGAWANGKATIAAAGAVLGLLLAWGCVVSSPPLPPSPTAPYDPVKQPLEICRPPYRAA